MPFGNSRVALVDNWGKSHFLNDNSVIFHLSEMVTSAEAASKREDRFLRIRIRGRVRDTKWAVMAVAVAKHNLAVRWSEPFVVAPLAEVVSAKAVEEGNAAAEHALPVNLSFAVLITDLLTGTVSLHRA